MVDKKPSVLIVDNEQGVCDLLNDELSEHGYLCTIAMNANDALDKMAQDDFDLVLLDIKLPGISGMEVLRKIGLSHRDTAIIMITVVNDLETAIEAIKLGASDYIVKPFKLDRVIAGIRVSLENKSLTHKSLSKMDAIARGVETHFDQYWGYSNEVTKRTIEIAQKLDIVEEEIQRWTEARKVLYSDRIRLIKSLLNKLQHDPVAQSMIGLAIPHLYSQDYDYSQN